MKKITFIGNGNMALSIAQGLKRKYHIEVVGRDMDRVDAFERELGVNIEKYLIKDFDISNRTILLCVKPANVEEVGEQLKGEAELTLSILAGTPISKLKQYFKTKTIIRAMPNLAASVERSMTTLTGDSTFKEEAQEILGAIGETLWLESEKELDIATALAGSGPAYLALIAEALADGAVKQGLKREYAMATMRGLFEGFGKLIQEMHPALLKDSVMSPGGTTASGYSALEERGVRSACIDAIERAYNRAKEL
jgi:pyrroline-5-carboxylate reductase